MFPLELAQGERIALVGGSLAERMSLFGHFEAMLHTRFPEKELRVRNFGWPADEVALRLRPADYTAIDDPLQVFGPDTVFCFFGTNESWAGPEGVEKFQADYHAFLDEFGAQYSRRGKAPRFLIVSPVAFESTGDAWLPEGRSENAHLALYTAAAAAVAEARGLGFVDLHTPTAALFSRRSGATFTINGLHLNEDGDREMARLFDRALFGTENPAKPGSPEFERLRAAVNDKSWIHSQDYRKLNGWYVYGSRRTHDTETFPREYAKIRAMVAVRDRYIRDLAQQKPVPDRPDDSETGELHVPATRFGIARRGEPPGINYPTPEESIAAMTPLDGFKVELFASEREFPELSNPVQINFDSKGRLWVACMPTYPQWRPGDPPPNDRLIILEDTNGDGRADTSKVFFDRLHGPNGFEFWNGGVLVVSQPRILFLKDTTGDDRADLVVEMLDGWGTSDTHHAIGAWEWSNGGLLHMLEGIAMSTTVETPWGPFRHVRSSGAYVLDPRRQRLRHFPTPGHSNPWSYVFTPWGNGIVGDGTTAQHHWDGPFSGAEMTRHRSLNTIFDSEGMRPIIGSELLYSRHFPDYVQGDLVYACVLNMNGLTRFKIFDDGAGFGGFRARKAGLDRDGNPAQVPDDLLSSADRNFRPIDPQIGPDGALYFGDWANAIIGHMSYSQRDPARDKSHGRIFRLVYPGRPLLEPATQHGKSEREIFEQFRDYEPRTRYRARRELWQRPRTRVLEALDAWVGQLEPADPQYERLLCEAMWVRQGHDAPDLALIDRILAGRSAEARGAAVQGLSELGDAVSGAVERFRRAATDPHPRVRLEAVRALSFHPTLAATEAVLLAAAKPLDQWLEYTLEAALAAQRPAWEPEIEAGRPVAAGNAPGAKFLAAYVASTKPEALAASLLGTALSEEASGAHRRQAIRELSVLQGDGANGKRVFDRNCLACHQVGGAGIDYGPDLTAVGARLAPYDLVRSVVDPGAQVDPRYVAVTVETVSGEAFSGFFEREDQGSLVIRIAGGAEMRFEKADITKRQNLRGSLMPAGMAHALSPAEFVDLIEYMKSLK